MTVKQVIIIRRDLFLCNRLRWNDKWAFPAHFLASECDWIKGNFRKICVVVNSEEELLSVVHDAEEAGLVAELIQDTGLTEFGGVPTYTAAAIGPDTDERIDPVTGHLVLY